MRERDLDNFLVEELHASSHFREWVLSRLDSVFEAPADCEIRLQKSPTRLQDGRQTDVQMGWFASSGDLLAVVLIESKVTADFQPGQAAAYVAETAAARAIYGASRAASVLVAPSARLSSLREGSGFDAAIAVEEIADVLARRRDDELSEEIDARLAVRIQLLDALCGKRSSSTWIATTVPEKRDFAEAYAALARERLPGLRVRPSSDGHRAITRIFEGLLLTGLPTPALRHEFGSGVAWRYVNAQFAGLEPRVPILRSSPLLSGTPYSAVPAGKSLAIRVATPGVDPNAAFPSQREAVLAGLDALDGLVKWLTSNAEELAGLLVSGGEGAAPVVTTAFRDAKAVEREFAQALRDTYAQCDALGYRPTAMLQMLERLGGLATARRLLTLPPSEGFTRLTLMGRRDLTIEALILEARWDGVFSEDERRMARRRLR